MRANTSCTILLAFGFAMFAKAEIATAQAAGEWRDAAHIWRATCGHCHDKALVGPELFGRELSLEAVRDWVRRGIGNMPPFPASQIDETELQELTVWINRQAPAANMANGDR